MSGRKRTPKRSPAKGSAKRPAQRRPANRGPKASTANHETREQLATASLPAVLFLHRLPKWALVAGPLLVLLLGLLLPYAWSGVLLLVLAAFLSWLIVLAWPRMANPARVMRVLVVLLLVGAGVAKMLGRLT